MTNNDGGKQQFMAEVIGILDGICKRKGFDVQIDAKTPIFERKILDSVTFVEFIAALETDLNVNVPDQKMSTQYFLTPECIASNFAP